MKLLELTNLHDLVYSEEGAPNDHSRENAHDNFNNREHEVERTKDARPFYQLDGGNFLPTRNLIRRIAKRHEKFIYFAWLMVGNDTCLKLTKMYTSGMDR